MRPHLKGRSVFWWSFAAVVATYLLAGGALVDIAVEDQVELVPIVSVVLGVASVVAVGFAIGLPVLLLTRYRRTGAGATLLTAALVCYPLLGLIDAFVLSALVDAGVYG